MQQIYHALQQGVDIRANLIALKKMLKEDGALDAYISMTEDDALLASFLTHDDPKVRKNAALVLGLIGSQESIGQLFAAYEAEQQLFVKSAYLEAMSALDYKMYEKQLRARLTQLLAYQPTEQEVKHVQEELNALRRLTGDFDGVHKHRFAGYGKPQDFILTTLKNYQDTTALQLTAGAVKNIPMGVQVTGGDIGEALSIRTYRELLFTLPGGKNLAKEPAALAQALVQCGITKLLGRLHEGGEPFYYRLEIKGAMTLEQKSSFAKKLAAALEQKTEHFLVNSTQHYEVELRLYENRAGGFFPCLKLYTLPMKRFSYRKYTTASSMHPSLAALLVELSSNWLVERAQVMDAFCGTGTLLMERLYALPARAAYGTDTFGEAILGARGNAQIARMQIHYVQRDFLEFTHDYCFDEIWADMPQRGKKTREEQDAFYSAFLKKAYGLLAQRGRIFIYSCESALVKKHVRMLGTFQLRQEFPIREKDGFYLQILERKA